MRALYTSLVAPDIDRPDYSSARGGRNHSRSKKRKRRRSTSVAPHGGGQQSTIGRVSLFSNRATRRTSQIYRLRSRSWHRHMKASPIDQRFRSETDRSISRVAIVIYHQSIRVGNSPFCPIGWHSEGRKEGRSIDPLYDWNIRSRRHRIDERRNRPIMCDIWNSIFRAICLHFRALWGRGVGGGGGIYLFPSPLGSAHVQLGPVNVIGKTGKLGR